MTHPTDEELDALESEIAKLAWSNADVAADAIRTLRAQLAEAQARADRAEAALAEARVQALRDAIAKFHAQSRHRTLFTAHEIEIALLAMIDKPIMSGDDTGR